MSAQHAPIGIFSYAFGGYYLGGMLSGIRQVTQKAEIPLIVIQQALGDQQGPILSSDSIAGWIVVHPVASDSANLAALYSSGVPVVAVPVPLEGMQCTLVQIDNRGGMRAAVAHLIGHGHRRIAYVDHGPHMWSQQRYLGYRDALAEHGIEHDPQLVIQMASSVDGVPIHRRRGEHAVAYLREYDLGVTGLACATDTCALSALKALHDRGLRVPQDMALVGFDDIVEAQYANPPLTTVRSPFDTIGRAAAEQLLAEIEGGQATRSLVISVPTTLLQRSSCGCLGLNERLAGMIQRSSDTWQTTLTRQLIQVVRYPLPLDPATPPAQIWPGAETLVSAIDAVLNGGVPDYAGIDAAWEQAIAQTENLEILNTALTLLEDSAEQRLGATPRVARRALVALLRRMRLELMRARLAHEVAPKQELDDQVRINYEVSMALLTGDAETAQSLGWLDYTPATWGCLSLWNDSPSAHDATLKVVGVYERHGTPTLSLGQQIPVTAFPPLDWLPASARQGHDLTILCPIRTQAHEWGVLVMCGWGDLSLDTSTETMIQAALLGATLDRNAVLAELTEQQAAIHAAYDREHALSQTIRELGCPVIPLLPGVLLVPLIGTIDSQRAQHIISNVLSAITEHQAQTILLDVTGVSIVDTQVASALMQTTRAAMLLGAKVVMVGIRPEIAQSIVGLGVDLQQLQSYGTLAGALSVLASGRVARG